ncbi:hypothetical protein Gotri_018876 [Gossypium trilobum]|uniref:Uncharacterized protein n=1 Tax=Gossypium trilobum TaxID=34281 RepID=A0A7J9EBR0_9ROSI|nr:hypothetical protein [Gossypium trilobum]
MGMSLRGTTVSADWSATCEQLLGKVPNKFKGSQIEMGWLENNFEHIEDFTSDVEKEQFVRAFILRLIGSLLMPDKFHNLFVWMLYSDPKIQECVLDELLANRSVWHVKVPLINFAMVEMQESDRTTFHKKHIEIWQHMYGYLSTREPFFTPKLVTSSDYMDWFTNHGKPYLLQVSEKSRQRRRRRPIQGPINPRSGGDAVEGPASAPHAHEDPIAVQPLGQYGSFIPVANPFYFTPSP